MDENLKQYLASMARLNAINVDSISHSDADRSNQIFNKKKEKQRITNEYLKNLPKRPVKTSPIIAPSRNAQAKNERQQNRIMDEKILEEGRIMNQFDMARGLGGREGIEKIKEVAESNPGGVSIFNKMNEGNITFNELVQGGLGDSPKMPYKPSETDVMQMENLIKQGMMPDDIKQNPAMAKVYNNSLRLQRLGERNVDAMLRSEEAQIASAQRDKEYRQKRAMDEAAERDRLLASGPNAYYGPGMTRDIVMNQAKNAVKYGEKDNIMAMVQGVMGGDGIGDTQGLMGMLNMRAVMQTAGADKAMLDEFDELGHRARIDKMDRDYAKMYGDKPKSITELMASRDAEATKELMAVKPVESKVKGLPKAKKSPLKEAMMKSQLFAGRVAKGFSDDSYKKYVQKGGYITKDGKQGYLLGGLATALAPSLIGGAKTAMAGEGGLLSTLSGMKDRYVDNPVAAGKLESIMASTDSEGNPIGEAEARKIRDAGGGTADFATTLGRGAKEFGKDYLSGLKGVGEGIVAGVGGIGKGLQAGYEGLTKNKASYEDLASGKEKGSLLQRLGKGLTFAGNVVDMANEDIPFSSLQSSDVQFYQGDGKPAQKQQGYINDASNVTTGKDQVTVDIQDGQVDKTGVELEGYDGKIIPSAILDKVGSMEDLKNLSPEQLMTVQKALGGIAVDGKFGPETEGAMQKYFDNANRAPVKLNVEEKVSSAPIRSEEEIRRSYPVGVDPNNPFPIIKQEGGFITELMNGGLV